MKKKHKVILYTLLLITGLLMVFLQVHVFEAPDGFLGFLVLLVGIYLIFGSLIKLCKLSNAFRNGAFEVLLDILDEIIWWYL
ncbi:MAG: hypothetical protein K2G45_03850 [Lachnospiraceae bacterium]|nr:hypothetical protein [Lachnospiraceae bacterium]